MIPRRKCIDFRLASPSGNNMTKLLCLLYALAHPPIFLQVARCHTYRLASTLVLSSVPLDMAVAHKRGRQYPCHCCSHPTFCQRYSTEPWYFHGLLLHEICADTMRLLKSSNSGELCLTGDLMDEELLPPYAILSHTWQHGHEVIFDDFENRLVTSKAMRKKGYDKILFCAQQAKRDNLDHVWVDTCCINKNDGVELQHAINSMFRWYQDASQCYVYLWDVSTVDKSLSDEWELAFKQSLWFTRGWVWQSRYAVFARL
jgi:hypothetical protein